MRKNVSRLVVFVLTASLFSFQAFAEEGLYLVAEVGTVEISGIEMSDTEKEIVNTPGVTSDYSVQDTGGYGAIGIGWRFSQYFSADVAYIHAAKFESCLKVSNIDGGTIDIDGEMVYIGSSATDVEYRREGEISAYRLGLNGQYPLTSWVGITGSAEVYQWEADVAHKVTLDSSGYYIGYNEHDSGTGTAVSAGLVFSPTKDVDVILRYRSVDDVTMPSLSMTYKM